MNKLATMTMMRNKLNNKALSMTERFEFFHEKGITVNVEDDDLFFLKADTRGHISELTDSCNGVVFRGPQLVCYHGDTTKALTMEEAKDGRMIWNENTIFIDNMDYQRVYMYWDPKKKDWEIADRKGALSSYRRIVKKEIFSIHSADPRFTYCLILKDKGEDQGIYLDRMFDVKTLRQVKWQDCDKYATYHKFRRPSVYAFEGFENLESGDFPILAQDQSMTRLNITGM